MRVKILFLLKNRIGLSDYITVEVLKSIPTIQDNMDLDNMIQYEQNDIMSFKLVHNNI